MRSAIMLFAIALVFNLGCVKNPADLEVSQNFEWGSSNPAAYGFNKDLLEQALIEASKSQIFASLLIVRFGDLVVNANFNGWDSSQRYEVRSVTKSFVSALVGIALEEGYLDSLDQKIVDFFPEYISEDMDPRKEEITIRHLLTMTSGFPSDEEAEALFHQDPDQIRQIFQMPLSFDPGTNFGYSSVGTHLLSSIITKATKMTTRVFADEFLCRPLNIHISLWARDPMGVYYGGTGIEITPRDLASFGLLYLNNGHYQNKQIVPVEWVQETFQTHVGGGWNWGTVTQAGYGYLWWLGDMEGYTVQMALGYAGQNVFLFQDLDMVVVTTAIFPYTNAEADQQNDIIFNIVHDYILPAVDVDS